MARRVEFNAPASKLRLDLTLAAHIPDLSRTRLQRLIREGNVTVDGEVTQKPGFLLEGGEKIKVLIPAVKPSTLQAESIPLDVIFEDEDLLVIDKPAGMVVHPSAGHDHGTLVHAVLAHVPDIQGVGGELRPGVVHRLDRETSGLILLAKNDQAHQELLRQFKEREVEKKYLALVDGSPPTPEGRVEAHIGRDPKHRKRMAVVPESRGREAISIYRTLERFPSFSFLEIMPSTGRTHQIRVHLAYLGCPIAGDRVYGRRKSKLPLKRQFLHASDLKVKLPSTKTFMQFSAPLPADLEETLSFLRVRG
jgi:23S rRNA pseudouridine1911/1915/1917 synthase